MADKVLVVDDEQEIRDLLSAVLSREGYEVLVASNGEEALELAQKENPRLILLDIVMPGLTGIEVCKRLKAEEKTRWIPVIMATSDRDRYTEALEAGAIDFVNKPFHLLELTIRVKSLLRIQHLTDELDRAVAYIRELQSNRPES